jgi:integral membrane sensor domain MASE1
METNLADQPGASELKNKQRQIIRSVLIVLVYLVSFLILDSITKQFEGFPGIVVWYPPVGLTYALLLVFGVRFSPAVILASFLSSLFIYHMPQPPYLLFLWVLINSLIYAAAALFLQNRIHFDWRLRKFRDVAWLVGVAVITSALLAILSVYSSTLSSTLPRSEIFKSIFHWWIGESVGILTVTPFLLIFVLPRFKPAGQIPCTSIFYIFKTCNDWAISQHFNRFVLDLRLTHPG